MIFTQQQLTAIAQAGGGLTVDASTLTFEQLRALAIAADGGKAVIVVKNVSGLTAAQLQTLAAEAPGLISFDLTS